MANVMIHCLLCIHILLQVGFVLLQIAFNPLMYHIEDHHLLQDQLSLIVQLFMQLAVGKNVIIGLLFPNF